MPTYINVETKEYPISEMDIRERDKNTSYSLPFQPNYPWAEVHEGEFPTFDHTKNVEEGEPTVGEDGLWYRNWILSDATDEQIIQRIEGRKRIVREERNQLLATTDWTQVKDISDSISEPWAAYRQSLRDITLQPNFPFEVNWPKRPS